MLLKTEIDINAPIEKVFEAFSDLENLNERIEGITQLEILEGPSKMAVGTKWRETRIMYGKEATEEMWVSDLETNAHYVVEAESHGTHYRSEYLFSETDEGTHVDLIFEGKPITMTARILHLVFFFMTKSVKKAFLADMSNLKDFCESN